MTEYQEDKFIVFDENDINIKVSNVEKYLTRVNPETLSDGDGVYIIADDMNHMIYTECVIYNECKTLCKGFDQYIIKPEHIVYYNNLNTQSWIGQAYADCSNLKIYVDGEKLYTKELNIVKRQGTPEFLIHMIRTTIHNVCIDDFILEQFNGIHRVINILYDDTQKLLHIIFDNNRAYVYFPNAIATVFKLHPMGG